MWLSNSEFEYLRRKCSFQNSQEENSFYYSQEENIKYSQGGSGRFFSYEKLKSNGRRKKNYESIMYEFKLRPAFRFQFSHFFIFNSFVNIYVWIIMPPYQTLHMYTKSFRQKFKNRFRSVVVIFVFIVRFRHIDDIAKC